MIGFRDGNRLPHCALQDILALIGLVLFRFWYPSPEPIKFKIIRIFSSMLFMILGENMFRDQRIVVRDCALEDVSEQSFTRTSPFVIGLEK